MVGVPGRSNACHTCRERKIRVCEPHLLHNMAPIRVYVVGSMLLIVFFASSAMVESRIVPAARGADTSVGATSARVYSSTNFSPMIHRLDRASLCAMGDGGYTSNQGLAHHCLIGLRVFSRVRALRLTSGNSYLPVSSTASARKAHLRWGVPHSCIIIGFRCYQVFAAVQAWQMPPSGR
jgi:hypothetical protein